MYLTAKQARLHCCEILKSVFLLVPKCFSLVGTQVHAGISVFLYFILLKSSIVSSFGMRDILKALKQKPGKNGNFRIFARVVMDKFSLFFGWVGVSKSKCTLLEAQSLRHNMAEGP